MKRVLTIQDISCLGKCSITVTLPLISAMGSECVILPTAILSTHTMFTHYSIRDLSDQLETIADHWIREKVHFDAIHTGYLGTQEEIGLVKDLIAKLRSEDTLVLVDPAMGDNGRLYARFDGAYARENASLCAVGDVMVPIITEACFMTDVPYRDQYDEDYIRELLGRLAQLREKGDSADNAFPGKGQKVVITGVALSEGKTGVMGLDTATGEYFSHQNDRIPVSYHGTGDIYSSVVAGALMRGLSWQDSVKLAADYVRRTVEVTLVDPQEPWYGVNFEETIPELVKMLEAAGAAGRQ